MKKFKLTRIKNMVIIGIMLLITSTTLTGCEANHNDGKCDICGKKATYKSSKEEYCDKHALDAAEWYMKQAVDYDNK